MMSNAEIMDIEINCLIEKLGTVNGERLISGLIQEKFDYIKWQRDRFNDMSSNDFNNEAVKYSLQNPFPRN